MKYLRTRTGTDWPERPHTFQRIVRALLFFVPTANPAYEPKLHRVREWLIEFDEAGEPWREIGLDAVGTPILFGPDARNYGFWLDTNMRLADFGGEEISAEVFEEVWDRNATDRAGASGPPNNEIQLTSSARGQAERGPRS